MLDTYKVLGLKCCLRLRTPSVAYPQCCTRRAQPSVFIMLYIPPPDRAVPRRRPSRHSLADRFSAKGRMAMPGRAGQQQKVQVLSGQQAAGGVLRCHSDRVGVVQSTFNPCPCSMAPLRVFSSAGERGGGGGRVVVPARPAPRPRHRHRAPAGAGRRGRSGQL